MIVVDTSALMAILLHEPGGDDCYRILVRANEVSVSAATMAEALIVAQGRNRSAEMTRIFDDLNIVVVDVNAASAQRAARAYAEWGKGNHPAGLNYGDCFAYELAKDRDQPLLYVGKDFSRTDIKSAL